MNTGKYLTACAVLLFGAVFSGVSAAMDPLRKADELPASLERKVKDFQAGLQAGEYEVARGYWTLWTVDDCRFPLQTIGSCYGNNPTAPYVLAIVPHWNDEFVDRSLRRTLTDDWGNMSPNYRLGEREALVVLAELPPPARYFGIQTNVFTREAQLNPNDPVYRLLNEHPRLKELQAIVFESSPNPSRRMLVASIGNSTNNVVIEQQSKENWGQQRFFVITPDEAMAAAMTNALAGVDGIEASQVFTEPVSPKLVRVGYGHQADDLITYIRYAMPNDNALGEQWRQQLPLTILRVRDKKGGNALRPFDIPKYEERIANTDERMLKEDLSKLVAAVKEHWGQTRGDNSSEFRSLSLWVDLIGQHCLGYDGRPQPQPPITLPRGPMNCLGDGQDADYQISSGTFHIDDDQVVAVVGTLGTKTGNATYTSLSVNWFPQLVGVVNRDDAVLEESAKKFKDKLTSPDLYKKFYVYYFARDCTGLYPWCQEIPRTLIPRGDTMKILQRNYVNPPSESYPDSRRGPDPRKVLNPISIEFDGSEGKRPTMR
jgi:hypothetical protein